MKIELNEKQKEIVKQQSCVLYRDNGELEKFAEQILSAHKVSFPEPSEKDKKLGWVIDRPFLEKIADTLPFQYQSIGRDGVNAVLLAFQKLMNEGSDE